MTARTRGFTLIELMIVITIIAVILAIAIPNLLAARKSANESSAIGTLKTISSAQTLFREGDREQDGTYDFGNLVELSNTRLVDGVLGAGVRAGYVFGTDQGTDNPEFLWFAVANPVVPRSTGDRYFCTSERGQIYYTTLNTITPNYTSCSIPANLLLVR